MFKDLQWQTYLHLTPLDLLLSKHAEDSSENDQCGGTWEYSDIQLQRCKDADTFTIPRRERKKETTLLMDNDGQEEGQDEMFCSEQLCMCVISEIQVNNAAPSSEHRLRTVSDSVALVYYLFLCHSNTSSKVHEKPSNLNPLLAKLAWWSICNSLKA